MKTSLEKIAYLFCVPLMIACGCSGDNSVSGKIGISLEEMRQKIVGTWQQDAGELKVEIRAQAELQGILPDEQAQATFEEELKSASRTYVFEASGSYRKKETTQYLRGTLTGGEESGQWRIVPKPESNQLWLQLSKDDFESSWSNSIVHCLEGGRLLIQDGGDGDNGDYTFTPVE